MDAELLSRIQFALTVTFHFLFPPISIGLGLCLVILEGIYYKTRNPEHEKLARFWIKVFGLVFGIGVASGIVMEFEFGTNWARYSRFMGDIFGSALAAEGIFAFFLESGFLAILLFGWERCSAGVHLFSTIMVCLGSHFSAVWILVANSFMQTPAGYKIVGSETMPGGTHLEIVDFWAMVFNPSTLDRITHTIFASWITGSALVLSISAYYLLKKRNEDFAKHSFKVGLTVFSIAVLLQGLAGDSTARGVAFNQPVKLAAMEGVFKTEPDTPLTLFGYVDMEKEKVVGVQVPGMLSFLVYGDFKTPVEGLKQTPEDLWPKVPMVFQMYHGMIALWGVMFGLALLAVWYLRKGTLWDKRWLLRIFLIGIAFPQAANIMGWYTAEMGRQPWVIYGLLKTSDAFSQNISAEEVLGSLILFTGIYLLLFCLFCYLLHQKVLAGPEHVDHDNPNRSTPH